MKRMENYYCIYTVADWIEATKTNLITTKDEPNIYDIKIDVVEILEMTKHNCFPIMLICFYNQAQKSVVLDLKLKTFFDFVSENIYLFDKNNRPLSFDDFSLQDRTGILNAKVPTLWINDWDLHRSE